MKKLLFLALCLFTCNQIYKVEAQQKPVESQVNELWKDIKKSQVNLSKNVTRVKELALQKIVYRTKTIIQHDTAWRIDTCTTVYKPIDSATIAIMFRQPDIKKEVKIGKRIQVIILKKRKAKSNEK